MRRLPPLPLLLLLGLLPAFGHCAEGDIPEDNNTLLPESNTLYLETAPPPQPPEHEKEHEDLEQDPPPPPSFPSESNERRFSLKEEDGALHPKFVVWVQKFCGDPAVAVENSLQLHIGEPKKGPGILANTAILRPNNKQGSLLLLLDNLVTISRYREECVKLRAKNPKSCTRKISGKRKRRIWIGSGPWKFSAMVSPGKGEEPRELDLNELADNNLKEIRNVLKQEFSEIRDFGNTHADEKKILEAAKDIGAYLTKKSHCGVRGVKIIDYQPHPSPKPQK
jgi:hypothetical protein